MKRQINCPHYIESSRKTGVYSYNLVAAELNLCKVCERKLRKEILKQDKIEKEMISNKFIKSLKDKNINRRKIK